MGAFAHMYLVAGVPTAEVLRGFIVPYVPRANIGQVGANLLFRLKHASKEVSAIQGCAV